MGAFQIRRVFLREMMRMAPATKEMTKREKLHYAREGISRGKTRDEVAVELG